MKFSRPTNLEKGQVSKIWPKKANLETLVCGSLWVMLLHVLVANVYDA